MKVKDIIKQSGKNWLKAQNNNPAFKTQEQTEFTWDNYNKLKKEAIDFDNKDVIFVEAKQ